MPEEFLHGLEVVEVPGAPGPIQVPASSVCGIVGSAKDLAEPGRRDTPVLIRSRRQAETVFGEAGTLLEALRGIYANAAVPVVCVNVFDPSTDFGAYGDGVEVVLAAGSIAIADVPADADIEVRSQDLATTYDVGDAASHLSWDGAELTRNAGVAGTPAMDATLNFRYRVPDPAGTTAAAVAGGVDADGVRTGVSALLGAQAEVEVQPALLGAPGMSGSVARGIAAVATALTDVARRLRAHAVIETPGTTDAEALALPPLLAARQAIVVDPGVRIASGNAISAAAATGYALGAIAAGDHADGPGQSPSGTRIRGIVGTTRAIEFSLSDPAAQSNVLNEGHVAVIVRSEERGWIWWGDRTCHLDAQGPDAWKRWIGASRAFDMIARGLLRSHLWAVSRNLKGAYFRQVAGRVNAFLRELRTRGAFQMARCEPSSRNTAETIQAGRAYWRLVWEPFHTAERLTFELEVSDQVTVLDDLEASAT